MSEVQKETQDTSSNGIVISMHQGTNEDCAASTAESVLCTPPINDETAQSSRAKMAISNLINASDHIERTNQKPQLELNTDLKPELQELQEPDKSSSTTPPAAPIDSKPVLSAQSAKPQVTPVQPAATGLGLLNVPPVPPVQQISQVPHMQTQATSQYPLAVVNSVPPQNLPNVMQDLQVLLAQLKTAQGDKNVSHSILAHLEAQVAYATQCVQGYASPPFGWTELPRATSASYPPTPVEPTFGTPSLCPMERRHSQPLTIYHAQPSVQAQQQAQQQQLQQQLQQLQQQQFQLQQQTSQLQGPPHANGYCMMPSPDEQYFPSPTGPPWSYPKHDTVPVFQYAGPRLRPTISISTPHKRRRGKRIQEDDLKCHQCGTRQTPEWRRGPEERKILCNACGIFHNKMLRKLGKQAAIEQLKRRPVVGDPLPLLVEKLN